MRDTAERATPTEVRSTVCPYCGAEPGEHCVGVRKARKANHQERVKAYERSTYRS